MALHSLQTNRWKKWKHPGLGIEYILYQHKLTAILSVLITLITPVHSIFPRFHLEMLSIILISALAVLVAITIQRLYLHPLSRFPGPKLAALTTLYTAYYDFTRPGSFMRHTLELHKRYGDVIRIAPNEARLF